MKPVLLLCGAPGTGKTTLIREALSREDVPAGGFYTEEMRSGGSREGFRIVTLEGQTATLAHVSFGGPERVGRYGVDVAALDRVGVPALRSALDGQKVVVVDEIGKMELLSEAFRGVVAEALEGGGRVLGTIMLAAHPWADRIKRYPAVEVVRVTRGNRQEVLATVSRWLREG